MDYWTQAASIGIGTTTVMMTSRCIGLHKNAEEAVRPLSIPSCWRRAHAIATTKIWNHELRQAVGEVRYGCGRPQGITQMTRNISSAMDSQPRWLFLQLDIKNAFSSMQKSHLVRVFRDISPMLAVVQQVWLKGLN